MALVFDQFWDGIHLEARDPLNDEIWHESPSVQREIQPAGSSWDEIGFGAQQAMRGISELPWVPDIVGRDACGEGAIVVVGAAYAGFIDRAISYQTYRESRSSHDFLAISLKQVIPRYREFYSGIFEALPLACHCRIWS